MQYSVMDLQSKNSNHANAQYNLNLNSTTRGEDPIFVPLFTCTVIIHIRLLLFSVKFIFHFRVKIIIIIIIILPLLVHCRTKAFPNILHLCLMLSISALGNSRLKLRTSL